MTMSLCKHGARLLHPGPNTSGIHAGFVVTMLRETAVPTKSTRLSMAERRGEKVPLSETNCVPCRASCEFRDRDVKLIFVKSWRLP
jgi:hypothetical protein